MMMDTQEYSEPVPYIGNLPYVFISYAHEDKSRVIPILKSLEANNILFWYDKAIVHGDSFREIIVNRIKKCEIFIVFITFNSISSYWVQKECNIADNEKPKRNIKLIPIYLDSVALSEKLEIIFSGIHAFLKNDVDKPDFYEKLFGDIKNMKNISYLNSKFGELISFYNQEHVIAGLTTRKFIHEMPLWHETVIILVILENNNILLQQKPLFSRIGRGKIGTFGGHVKYGESYITAAIREVTEELGLENGMIKDKDLILMGKLGDFKVKERFSDESQIYYNYEFSSVYCYFLNKEFVINPQENFGDSQYMTVKVMQKSLDSIQEDFKENTDNFADGLSRILKRKEAINEIKQIISSKDRNYISKLS